MSPKTIQKLSHLLGCYNSCCCPMQLEELMTIQDLRLEMTVLSSELLDLLDCANPGVQEDSTLKQQQYHVFLCNHNNQWNSFLE